MEVTSGSINYIPTNEDVEPDIEDIVNEEMTTKSHSHTIQIDGKPVHKASILRVYSHPSTHSGPKSTDRLHRVRGYKRFESIQTSSTELSLSESPTLFINDPILTLVKVEDDIFLAAAQITGFKVNGFDVQSLPQSDLKSNCKVFFQILKLVTCEPTTDEPPCDWVCDGSIINYGSIYSILEACGDLVQVFNPVISCNRDERPLLRFSSTELTAVTTILHQQLADMHSCHVPTANYHDFFPYRYNDDYRNLWELSEDERQGMENKWSSIRNTRMTKNKKKKAGLDRERIVISDGHSSHLALRETDLILPESSSTSARGLGRPSKRKVVEAQQTESSSESSAEEDAGDDDDEEYCPKIDNQLTEHTQAYFTEAAYSRRGRKTTQRKAFFEEICDCGMGDNSVNILKDDWKSNPDLIECQAVGCETKVDLGASRSTGWLTES
ncbi:hypothetical protein Clacol_010075 [Clathrus columnatus]|uniref:Uncharacterized protein n=1 Tax=Clathrus columnatus TaxID=1419009 RepID=A0AAV5AM91_9AGAM|nr:hypothetical protein Clacol_010075 [Clathrus columnatus]